MKHSGGCHCGAVRFEVEGDPRHLSFCHCGDCRKAAGAPMVAWAGFPETAFAVTKGQAKARNSSGTAMRSFCPECGTGMWYTNAEFLPGIVDIQTATLDNPEVLPPQLHVQVAERIAWMKTAHELPEFERFPSSG